MRSRHHMPFGAEAGPDGVQFRIWTPGARTVDLRLEQNPDPIPMPIDDEGWAEILTRAASPGTRYQYCIDGELRVPDPVSRFQPDDVHGPSEVVDAEQFEWTDDEWTGRPWEEMVFYELHVGTFTLEGTFRAVQARLPYLADLGVTAIELMPVADFPGRWSWGYDGALLFAPDSRYGRPEALKALVAASHALRMAVFLDVVYSHLGPEGNYLHRYAPPFFTARYRTPWGDALNFDGPRSEVVRAFVRENALFWLEEYHLDGLRLDAVHAIHDESATHILDEVAAAVQAGPGARRRVYLVTENDDNEAHYLRPDGQGRRRFAAQWNDDMHHALHVACTGDRDGYYIDYPDPVGAIARCLTEGLAFQGEHSVYRGRPRGEGTVGVPVTAFVNFLQNHDQVGNRAFGERVTAIAPAAAVRAVTAILLLAPSPPLLFMGEEWAAREPFLFFCDFGPDMAPSVVEGRRAEFALFAQFRDPAVRDRIPSPQDPSTHERSVLDWGALDQPEHRERRNWIRRLLHVRQREIVPRLTRGEQIAARAIRLADTGLAVEWGLPRQALLRLTTNLGSEPLSAVTPWAAPGRQLYATGECPTGTAPLAPWYVAWYLKVPDLEPAPDAHETTR